MPKKNLRKEYQITSKNKEKQKENVKATTNDKRKQN